MWEFLKSYPIYILALYVLSSFSSQHTLEPSGKLVLIVYKSDGVAEHAVLIRPHGNTKTNVTKEQGKARRIC
jgi:hypothetical protein